ncbi:PIR protein [Plasmodium ovale]|uniref:PIR protein n=1 Tax=Plasmodium ovale TaxID=36330 RepID=A0A1C3KJV2_PLAOA|nr:PIR protein [Plasmodium ovale]
MPDRIEDDDEVEDFDDAAKLIAGENYYTYVKFFKSYKNNFDEIISGDNNEQKYGSKCDSIKNTYFSNNNDFITFCYKFSKYLDNLNDSKYLDDRYMRCAHFNYLLNSNKEYNSISKFDKSILIKACKDISKNVSDSCYGYIDTIREDILENLEEIYNMYKYLNQVKEKNALCSGDCCVNAKECVTIYDKYIKNCYIYDTKDLCKALSNFKYEYEEHMKSIECPGTPQILASPYGNDPIFASITSFIIILVILSLSFMLYKFTPFGTWINTKLQNKKKILNNLYEDTFEPLKNYTNKQLSSANSIFKVKYNPV